MLRQMERSTVQLLAKRGKSIRQIAAELGRSPTTIARVLREPVDRRPARRQRASQLDPYRPQLEAWVREGLSTVRMLERLRTDSERPYTGGRSTLGDYVRRLRQAEQQQQAAAAVPIRFEGLPGEYLQVDWGEVRRFPFMQQAPATRYFLACRLKYSRWTWVRFTSDMRQETLFRGLVDCFLALGWVPWVLVFDNMKTVTSDRDQQGQPIWTPALLQFAGEFGFHPQACDPGAGNQKGAVESLVKWVKGNFLVGRRFADDADLAAQAATWVAQGNAQPSQATGEIPVTRLSVEAAKGNPLPSTAHDYGILEPGVVSREALVAVHGNRYSVPIAHVGAPVTVRVHVARIRLWRDMACIAEHPRAPNSARQRVMEPAHFAPLFGRKRRAQVMLYRDVLVALGGVAPAYVSELSNRHRDRLRDEILAVYELYEQHGAAELLTAMARAAEAGSFHAEAVRGLLTTPSASPIPLPCGTLVLAGVPAQAEIDRLLSTYETWVEIDVAMPEVRA